MVEQVQAWRDSEGCLHPSREAAEATERRREIHRFMDEIIPPSITNYTRAVISNAVCDNAEKLMAILTGTTVEERPQQDLLLEEGRV